MVLVAGSLLLVPIFVLIHPPMGQIAHDALVPHMPQGAKLSDVLLLIIAVVGTTVAPWQLFFQQSYVIDKRITPRFLRYARVDLWIGIAIVIIGAIAMMSFTAATFIGTPEFGGFSDAAAVATGMEKHFGRLPGILFAIALIDASIIGACAVSLSTAYAIGDVFAVRHSLHRKPGDAKLFYAVYTGLIVVAAALVLTPGTPLGLLTNLVQSLAGVLLPSATVFLLLLCNDQAVLGPWVGGSMLIVAMAVVVKMYERWRGQSVAQSLRVEQGPRESWRMPPLASLAPARITLLNRLWMLVLRGYLLVAAGMLLAKLVQLAFSAT